MLKRLMAVSLIAGMALPVCAENMRTRLTKENKFPELMGVQSSGIEAGFDFVAASLEDSGDSMKFEPYLRFRPLEDLVIYGNIPYHDIDGDLGSDSGLGNTAIGAELRVFEDLDIIKYPWVMLHGQIDLETGDSDLNRRLGQSENSTMIGIAAGTSTRENPRYTADFWEKLNWALDLRYRFLDESDDFFSVATSLLWEFSRDFALIAEFEMRSEEGVGESDRPMTLLGGLSYDPTDDLSLTFHVGTVENSSEEFLSAVKVSILF